MRLLKKLFLALLVLAVGAAGASLVSLQAHSGKVLSVQTGSMTPTLKQGDLVVVQPTPTDQLAEGDIVTVVEPGNMAKYVTHRIVDKPTDSRRGIFITKGDANPMVDAPVHASYVVGRVTVKIPYVGKFFDFVRQPLGLILLVYVPALIIIIMEIRHLANHYRRMDEIRRRGNKVTKRAVTGTKVAILTCALMFGFYAPASAGLLSAAEVTDNFAVAVRPWPAAAPVFSEVSFACRKKKDSQESVVLSIAVSNPTNQHIRPNGWYIENSSGRLVTLQRNNMLNRNNQTTVFSGSVDASVMSGDRLLLYDNEDRLLDALSWGSDASQFNPALPTADTGIRFAREPVHLDSNTIADWAVSQETCKF